MSVFACASVCVHVCTCASVRDRGGEGLGGVVGGGGWGGE